MDKIQQLHKLGRQLSKIESLDRVNRLVLLACFITTFHSLSYIHTDKRLNPIHYLGYAVGVAGCVASAKLGHKKQKYQDQWCQLQREG